MTMTQATRQKGLKKTKSSPPSMDEALLNLYTILETHMSMHPNLSVNHLSKKCGVSEPTLRRLHNRQLKRLPTSTNILKLLSHIAKKDRVSELVDFFPGALMDYIKESMTQILESDFSDVTDLTDQLKNPMAYLIYKIAATNGGITQEKIVQLFGMYGEQQLNRLLEQELIYEEENTFLAKHKKFSLAPEVFKGHLKATADFIKPDNLTNSPYKYSQTFYNMSSSVNINAYAKILKVKRTAIRKIRDILFNEKSTGDIPIFVIGAIDSLDDKSPYEISQSKKS